MYTEAADYLDAARMFERLVARIDPDTLDGPGLGGWDLRALVGHTSRSLTTVLTYLDEPAPTEAIDSPERYYALIAGLTLDPADVEERGRAAGAALGDHPAAAVSELVERVTARLDGVDPDTLLTTIGGGMRLVRYLPTRVFELAVHGLDIGAATGLDPELPASVLVSATGLATRISVLLGTGPELLGALTGRRDLPPGFSVVG
jgi:uncharacterized protein (TIGR03083 family)